MQNKISFLFVTILAIELGHVCLVEADAIEEEVRLRIKVAQNDLCSRNDLTDDQIIAIQQCPDFKAYEIVANRECLLKLTTGKQLRDVKCELIKAKEADALSKKVDDCVTPLITAKRKEVAECQEKILSLKPERTVLVSKEFEAARLRSKELMKKWCADTLEPVITTKGLRCVEVGYLFADKNVVGECAEKFLKNTQKGDEEELRRRMCDDSGFFDEYNDSVRKCSKRKLGAQPKEPEFPDHGERKFIMKDNIPEPHPEEELIKDTRRMNYQSDCLEKALG